MSSTPIFANVINVGKVPMHLRNGHGNSVSVNPHTSSVPVSYEFITWEPVPSTIKVLSYVMSDGKVLTTLPKPSESEPMIVSN